MVPFDAALTRIEGPDSDGSLSVLTGAPPQKIRGRPRRGNRGRPIPQGLSPTPAQQGPVPQSPEILAIQGTNLTPYVLKVEMGEEIISKIKAFTKEESWKDETMVILSATGSISSVNIGYNGDSVIRIIPKGRYDILSLKGSFTVSKSRVCQTEGLMVSLAETDNSVFGGSVVGMLIAATPIQVVVGSFTNAKGDGGSGSGGGGGRGRGSSSNSPYDSRGSSSDPPPSDLRAPSQGGSGSRCGGSSSNLLSAGGSGSGGIGVGGGSLSNPLSIYSGDFDPSQYIIPSHLIHLPVLELPLHGAAEAEAEAPHLNHLPILELPLQRAAEAPRLNHLPISELPLQGAAEAEAEAEAPHLNNPAMKLPSSDGSSDSGDE